ncbi:hypothetical protein EDB86DRAFT_2841103 [Lactarius hatsudake]|nr:hypothetical protein EDB86DRAFT_2841103 [Lactarius hatsudake]
MVGRVSEDQRGAGITMNSIPVRGSEQRILADSTAMANYMARKVDKGGYWEGVIHKISKLRTEGPVALLLILLRGAFKLSLNCHVPGHVTAIDVLGRSAAAEDWALITMTVPVASYGSATRTSSPTVTCKGAKGQNYIHARAPPMQANAISVVPPPAPVPPVNMTTVMNHLLNLNEQERDTVINNLLMMGGSTTTPQINVIGLNFALSPDTPLRDVAFQLDTVPDPITPLPIPPPFLADIAALSQSDSPPCRLPHSPRRPSSPQVAPPPLPIVEDNNSSGRGAKTSSSTLLTSVLTQVAPIEESPHPVAPITPCNLVLPAPVVDETKSQIPSSRPPRSPLRQYQPIFLTSTFERPRDPDEVVQQAQPRLSASRSASHHEDTRNTVQPEVDPSSTRNHSKRNPEARRSRRTLYATNNDIHTWLQQTVYNNPSLRPRVRPPPPLGYITEERTNTDPEL